MRIQVQRLFADSANEEMPKTARGKKFREYREALQLAESNKSDYLDKVKKEKLKKLDKEITDKMLAVGKNDKRTPGVYQGSKITRESIIADIKEHEKLSKKAINKEMKEIEENYMNNAKKTIRAKRKALRDKKSLRTAINNRLDRANSTLDSLNGTKESVERAAAKTAKLASLKELAKTTTEIAAAATGAGAAIGTGYTKLERLHKNNVRKKTFKKLANYTGKGLAGAAILGAGVAGVNGIANHRKARLQRKKAEEEYQHAKAAYEKVNKANKNK